MAESDTLDTLDTAALSKTALAKALGVSRSCLYNYLQATDWPASGSLADMREWIEHRRARRGGGTCNCSSTLPAPGSASPGGPSDADLPAGLPADTLERDRQIFDLVLSGYSADAVIDFLRSVGVADPKALAMEAVERFVNQADGIPVVAQMGFLLDSFRELARKASEIGDFQGARQCLNEYNKVVRYLHENGMAHAIGGGNANE